MTNIQRRDPKSGKMYLRNGTTVSFFLPTPMAQAAVPISKVFETYLKLIPEGSLRWAAVGANAGEWRPITKVTFSQCRSQLKVDAVTKRPLTALELTDGDVGGCAPNYGITVIGQPFDAKFPDKRTLVQMYYPIEVTDNAVVEQFVGNVCRLAALLPYVSGYVSPGLHCTGTVGWLQARAIAKLHPGYDVQDNAIGRRRINSKVRGARWLSFLGQDIAGKVGGMEGLRRELPSEIEVIAVGHGVLIRAGKQPELGDARRKIGTPLLRRVAKVLEPVTLFRESALLRTDFAGEDEEMLFQWERRFLD
jgi:hypothetical protein